MASPKLVVLGGPNSGKTHLAGQIYGRVQRRPGHFRLRKEDGTPADISALEEVLAALESGHAAGHTPSGTWAEIKLPLESDSGARMDLHWPDYGGEQLDDVFEKRSVPDSWRARLCEAGGWIVLIRLKTETVYSDALEQLVEHAHTKAVPQARAEKWDANARWVELLQMLLHASGRGAVNRLSRPRLLVLLSCYDELGPADEAPMSMLERHLPMLASFLRNTWAGPDLSVWGLSALGRLLTPESTDDDFINRGPEFQGWVIHPDGGAQDTDLTAPLGWLSGTV
ncbi:hypothetical protein HHL24_37320 [Paraburkholderia sp. RP-4-7]|uniref:Double-GTPase 1 domain-containing protein n=1 Tax=Paraburkholderia polaris TaxID=2728848 RepID=A0A848IX35_9BURK|nr:hypothetical protein [Paraburkholderia polaris]NMM03527.1 hypothetical protein [Paraburkholderia polaris]